MKISVNLFYHISKLRSTLENIKKHILQDDSTTIDITFSSIDKWFTEDAQISFSKIRRAIKAEECIDYRNFFVVQIRS